MAATSSTSNMVAEPTTMAAIAALGARVASLELTVGKPPEDKLDELDLAVQARLELLEKEFKAEITTLEEDMKAEMGSKMLVAKVNIKADMDKPEAVWKEELNILKKLVKV